MPTTEKHKPGDNGFGQCPHCGRPVHIVNPNGPNEALSSERQGEKLVFKGRMTGRTLFFRHNPIPRLRVIPDRSRTHCSKCNKPGEWYEFKPGSGECTECQT